MKKKIVYSLLKILNASDLQEVFVNILLLLLFKKNDEAKQAFLNGLYLMASQTDNQIDDAIVEEIEKRLR